MMSLLTVKSRIALAQVMVVICTMLIAAVIGLVPNRREAVLRGRAELAEAIAVHTAVFVNRDDLAGLETSLANLVRRNRQLVSVAVLHGREPVVMVGNHASRWDDRRRHALESQLAVPIRAGDKPWGELQICLVPLSPQGTWTDPVIRLAIFTGAFAFLINYLYFGRTLRHLDPGRAVPSRVRNALDTLTEGLLVIDTRQRIVLANQAFADYLAVDPARLVGKSADSIPWTSDDREPAPFPWVRAMESGERQTGTMMGMRHDSGSRTFMVNAAPVLGPNGDMHGVLVSFDDVTPLELAKVALRKSKEEADQANRAKSDFLANMSHEIRTPMNAILGFTEVLRRGFDDDLEQRREYLNTIHASGRHLLNLINDILDLSKIESRRLDLELQPCSPFEVIHEVVRVIQVEAKQKAISLSLCVEGKLPERIITDPTRLRQLVTNLVGNAIKFTDEGGVRIIVRCDAARPRPQLEVEVTDTGIGMSDEAIRRIFDPFVQADATVTRRYGGTGLGLSISKRLAEALGGGLTVTSQEGKGSTFRVQVETGPLKGVRLLAEQALRETVRTEEAAPTELELPPARVLVADDQEANRKLMHLVLGRAGVETELVTNGEEAVERARSGRFDAVLMDMQMPVMDGLTATRKLREDGFSRPIIALTADAMKGSEQRCREAGCSAFLTKPIEMERLLGALSEALGAAGQPAAGRADPPAAGPAAPAPAKRRPDTAAKNAEDDDDLLLEEEEVVLFDEDPEARAIVEDYVGHLKRQLLEINTAWTGENYEMVAQLAHAIRGSAGTLGLNQFTAPAARLQSAAEDGDAGRMGREIEALVSLAEDLVVPAPTV